MRTSDYEEYAKRYNFYSDELPELLAKYIGSLSYTTLLEVGCGDGKTLLALARKGFLEGKSVCAVDLSTTRVERMKNLGLDIDCFVEDACDLKSIEDGTVDFLISMQVIEHVPDDSKMVREIYRVLRAGGHYYLSTIFKKWYGWYYYRCNGRWVYDPTHLREYSREDQLIGMLSKNGLKPLESRKTLCTYAPLDSILRRRGASPWVYENKSLVLLRRVKVVIPGYYEWELVGSKTDQAQDGVTSRTPV